MPDRTCDIWLSQQTGWPPICQNPDRAERGYQIHSVKILQEPKLIKPSLLIKSALFLLLALTMLVLQLNSASVEPLLQFDRSALAQGEYWRLFSAHLIHTNRWHLLMNLAALAVIFLMHVPHYTAQRILYLLVAGLGLIGLAIWLWSPAISYYLGLSGWLHALLVWGACQDIQRHWSSGWLILAGVAAKIGWEQWQGASQQLITLIEADVATDAHFYGAVTGLLLYLISLIVQYIKQDHRTTA
jgi:rhomboid family GlyGly-CTERM serine protease